MKTEGPGPTAPGDQRHQGNQRNPKVHRKTKDSLSIPLRTHAGSTREAPSSRRTTFYLISQNKVKHQAQRARAGQRPGGLMTIKSPATGSRTQEPLRFPGLSKPPTSDHSIAACIPPGQGRVFAERQRCKTRSALETFTSSSFRDNVQNRSNMEQPSAQICKSHQLGTPWPLLEDNLAPPLPKLQNRSKKQFPGVNF